LGDEGRRPALRREGPDLWTEKAYANFILQSRLALSRTPVEKEASSSFRTERVDPTEKVMDAGDSGIFLRGAQKSQP